MQSLTPGLHQSSSNKIRASQLWGKNKEELKKQLEEQKQELVALRTQKIAGGAQSKLNKMYVNTRGRPGKRKHGENSD